ncbi:MAG: Plug domain-containing protein, partial [Kangiella sp.]|nr:Plug domain-containing protein [Kangiella sp.]
MTIRSNLIAKAVKMALLATASASLALTATVNAAEEQEEDEVQEEERMVIVGSRLKRNEFEGASPVITITADDMKEQGHTTVYDALDNLTINNGVQIEGPEFSGGFTPDIRTLNIRGFGIGNTLTLINGR